MGVSGTRGAGRLRFRLEPGSCCPLGRRPWQWRDGLVAPIVPRREEGRRAAELLRGKGGGAGLASLLEI